MFGRKRQELDVRTPGVQYGAYDGDGPFYPMQVLNGLVVRKPNRQAPENDADLTPREFRRMVDASGAQAVQLSNGLQRYTGMGFRVPYVDYLYASTPIIPGQSRDDYGGKVKVGPSSLEYQGMVNDTIGSQPQAPGGVRQFAANQIYNPGTS